MGSKYVDTNVLILGVLHYKIIYEFYITWPTLVAQ